MTEMAGAFFPSWSYRYSFCISQARFFGEVDCDIPCHLSWSAMFARLSLFMRALLLLAGILSSLPSLEGAVLCRWGSGEVALEPGVKRCMDSAVAGIDLESVTQVGDASQCGSCVDIPLSSTALAVHSVSRSSLKPILHPQVVTPVLHEVMITTLATAFHSQPNGFPPPSQSKITPPLRR